MRSLTAGRSLLLSALLLPITTFVGCGYPEVSPTTYEYAKALVSITIRRASDQLQPIRAKVDSSLEQGDISDQEHKWLIEIIDAAASGTWADAAKSARRIMEDQIKMAP